MKWPGLVSAVHHIMTLSDLKVAKMMKDLPRLTWVEGLNLSIHRDLIIHLSTHPQDWIVRLLSCDIL